MGFWFGNWVLFIRRDSSEKEAKKDTKNQDNNEDRATEAENKYSTKDALKALGRRSEKETTIQETKNNIVRSKEEREKNIQRNT